MKPSEDYAGLVKWLRNKAESLSEIYPPEAEAADALEAVLAERDALKAGNESMKQSLPLWAHKQMAANNELIERLRAERDALAARLAPVEDEALVERDDFAEQIALRSENGISKDLQEFLRKFKEDDSAAIRMFAQYRDLEIEMDSWKSLWEKTNAHMRQVEAERDALLARLAPVDDKALVEIAARTIVKENVYKETQIPSKTLARAAIAAIRPHIEAAERERCAAALEITSDEIRLHAGEMTAQEMRSVLSVLAWRAAAIRSGK